MANKTTALFIVESPTKAKKIQTYVPRDIEVIASVGHIRDLPKSTLGVNIAKDFEPMYEIPKQKQPLVTALRKAASNASIIYLASDPDREGESIAWHLYEVLKDLPGKRTFYRIRYHEITQQAVLEALAHPTEIDLHLVHAQQARRVIDRLAGYRLSKLISRAVHGAKSAGRVQSAALRLIVERERAIQDFRPTPYAIVSALLEKGLTFEAQLHAIDGLTPKFTVAGKEIYGLPDIEEAKRMATLLQGRNAIVTQIEHKTLLKRPQLPFTTSTLQQAAATRLGYSPDQTMQIAQRLYEEGYITYMRTDGTQVSDAAREAAQKEIIACFGAAYSSPQSPKSPTSKQKEAPHPPIMPTDVTRHQLPPHAEPHQIKLYNLIWRRFMASQMAPAQFERTLYTLSPETPPALPHIYHFVASTSTLRFSGYRAVWDAHLTDEESDTQQLPPLTKGEVVTCRAWQCTAKETLPPAHFNEASLVKELETRGIGRPSTYASTLRTLVTRRYVTRGKGHLLTPTALGEAATHYLLKEIADFVNIDFTRNMELTLDQIAAGQAAWVETVNAFYQQLLLWIQADPTQIQTVLTLLSHVTTWRDPTSSAQGRTPWSDQHFYEEMKDLFTASQTEATSTPITKAQLATLIRIASNYFDELPTSLTHVLKEASPKTTPINTTEEVTHLLQAFEHVTAWQPPTHRGKRTYDDQAFVKSLQAQVVAKGYLTERQVAALKKLARVYHLFKETTGETEEIVCTPSMPIEISP